MNTEAKVMDMQDTQAEIDYEKELQEWAAYSRKRFEERKPKVEVKFISFDVWRIASTDPDYKRTAENFKTFCELINNGWMIAFESVDNEGYYTARLIREIEVTE